MNPTPLRWLATVLWTDDRHKRIRLKHWTLTLAINVACAGAISVFTRWDVLSVTSVRAWLTCVVLGLSVIHVLIRSGWSDKRADPGMSQVQIVFGVFAVMSGYALMGEARSAALLPLMVIFTFGAYSVPGRRLAGLTLFALVAMGVTMLAMHQLAPGRFQVVVDLSNFLVSLIVLPAASAVAILFGSLRVRLVAQRHELKAALARIQDLATLDDLTGLANRRRAQEMLSAEVARSQRTAQGFTVALVDLDRFKRLNDRFGHAGGDAVLRRFADEARASVRGVDMVARWGGEEFVILMPETDEAAAMGVLERLRERVNAAAIPSIEGEMRFSFSAGVASHRPGYTVADTVAIADRALYRAKAAGRNRVELAGEEDAPPSVRAPRSSRPPAALPASAPSPGRPPVASDGSPAAGSATADPR